MQEYKVVEQLFKLGILFWLKTNRRWAKNKSIEEEGVEWSPGAGIWIGPQSHWKIVCKLTLVKGTEMNRNEN